MFTIWISGLKDNSKPQFYWKLLLVLLIRKQFPDYKLTTVTTTKFQCQYVSFIISFVFDLRWLNDFIFIYKHYINSHANTQDRICLISNGQNWTSKSGHSRSKPKCSLIFPIVDIMVILWKISRPLPSQTPGCHESIPKQRANALWHLSLASRFIHEDKTPQHLGCHPIDMPWFPLNSKICWFWTGMVASSIWGL